MTGVAHLAIAVKDIQESLKIFQDALGMRLVRIEDVPTENVKTAFLQCGSLAIELLEPTKPDSAVGRFLEKRGEGLHHLALNVPSLKEVMERLRASGFNFVGDAPRPGAMGSRVAFIHPKSTGGVLIELVETGSPSPPQRNSPSPSPAPHLNPPPQGGRKERGEGEAFSYDK